MMRNNPRTAAATSPRACMSVRSVAVFTLVCSLAFVTATLLFLPNRWPLYLSVPVLLWLLELFPTASDSPAWLISGWAFRSPWHRSRHGLALRGDLEWPRFYSALAVLLWVSGFDIIYACQDVDFDRHGGDCEVYPRCWEFAAAFSGSRPRRACLDDRFRWWALGLVYPLGLDLISVGVAGGSGRSARLRARSVGDDLTRVNVAFFQVNVIISMGLLKLVAVVDLFVWRSGWNASQVRVWPRNRNGGSLPHDPMKPHYSCRRSGRPGRRRTAALEGLCRDYWFPLYAVRPPP